MNLVLTENFDAETAEKMYPCLKWLASLPRPQYLELLQLEQTFWESQGDDCYFHRNVNKDWIEEHGGIREWWGYLRLDESES